MESLGNLRKADQSGYIFQAQGDKRMAKKWVYLFNEVGEVEKYAGSWEGVRGLLGGKGSGLADMTRAGVPVPPGYTVTTEACNEFRKNDAFPAGQWDQQLAAL